MIRSATFAIALLLIPVFALAADLEVTWTAPDDDRITGYKLYHTQSPYWRSYTIVDVGDVTSHTISDYSAGDIFWISATSYDSDGNESVFSETLRVEVETDGTPTSKELRRLKFSTGSVSAVIGGGSHTINWE